MTYDAPTMRSLLRDTQLTTLNCAITSVIHAPTIVRSRHVGYDACRSTADMRPIDTSPHVAAKATFSRPLARIRSLRVPRHTAALSASAVPTWRSPPAEGGSADMRTSYRALRRSVDRHP